jgi:hypothetical protein
MEGDRREEVPEVPVGAEPSPRVGSRVRVLDRFFPAQERLDAFWIVGVAAALGAVRALAYHPLQVFVSNHVVSPGVEEFGFALRATAIADALWVLIVAVLAWALLTFTRAPKAVALYLVLGGVLVGAVSLGNRLAIDTVMILAGSQYQRSLWSDMQPIMLTLAETVGVVLGAWAAHLASGEKRADGGDTLLPALGWEGRPLSGAAWLAATYAAARFVGQLAGTLILFGPQAYEAVWLARRAQESVRGAGLVSLVEIVAPVLVYFLIGYLGVKRFGLPRSIWLAFLGAGIPSVIAVVQLLTGQLAAANADFGGSVNSVLSALRWLALGVVPVFLGVWLATRPTRVSVSSDTLSAEDRDHW